MNRMTVIKKMLNETPPVLRVLAIIGGIYCLLGLVGLLLAGA